MCTCVHVSVSEHPLSVLTNKQAHLLMPIAMAAWIFQTVMLCISPLPCLSSLSLLFSIHHIQMDKQSSGGRRLGPFSKDTFEMVQHVTDGYPLHCQVMPAVCGQVYIKGRHINRLPLTRTHIQFTQTSKHALPQHPQLFSCCLSCGALKRSMLRFHWDHLQVLRPCFAPQGHLKGNVLIKKGKERQRDGKKETAWKQEERIASTISGDMM